MAEKLCQQEGKAPCLTQRLTFSLRKERVHSCRNYGASRHGLRNPLPPSRPYFLKVQPSPHKAAPLKECIVHRRHFVFRSQRLQVSARSKWRHQVSRSPMNTETQSGEFNWPVNRSPAVLIDRCPLTQWPHLQEEHQDWAEVGCLQPLAIGLPVRDWEWKKGATHSNVIEKPQSMLYSKSEQFNSLWTISGSWDQCGVCWYFHMFQQLWILEKYLFSKWPYTLCPCHR